MDEYGFCRQKALGGGVFSRDVGGIQRNGLPRKGISRSTQNLREVGLSAVAIDFEGVKIPTKSPVSSTNGSTSVTQLKNGSAFPPSYSQAKVFPAMQHGSNGVSLTPNRSSGNLLSYTNGLQKPRERQPFLGDVSQRPTVTGVIEPPDYRQVCENPAYRYNLSIKRDSLPGLSAVQSKSSLSSEENGYTYNQQAFQLQTPNKAPGLSSSSSVVSLDSPRNPVLESSYVRRPLIDSPSYEAALASLDDSQLPSKSRPIQAVQATITSVQAASPTIAMQPAKSYEVRKPVPQHASIPAPLKARKSGTPSKFGHISQSPYQTPSPTGFEGSNSGSKLDFSPHGADFDTRPESAETFISRTGSSTAQFVDASQMEPVGPLATGRCEPVLPARFRNQGGVIAHQSPTENNLEQNEMPVVRKHRYVAPNACKFYMECHMENIVKYWDARRQRREQLEQEMMRHNFSESFKDTWREVLNKRETEFLRERRVKMRRSNFTKIRTIGMGGFGEVALVKKNDSSRFFAMKTLSKKHIVQKNQIAHVLAERDILAEAENEWVVKLYYSFQDVDNLYLVMEYVPGGDLMKLLQRLEQFDENLARFYTAELICAIGSVHEMGFIHRDIKPDNILIDVNGHLKLTDFGLCTGFRWTHNSTNYDFYERAKDGSIHVRTDSLAWHNRGVPEANREPPKQKKAEGTRKGGIFNRKKQFAEDVKRKFAHSQVGTPNYMAPEVLLSNESQGYTQVCDWWSVGVILYEMLCGRPPFSADTAEETQLKVMDWRNHLNLSSYLRRGTLSLEAADLIKKLLCDADERLGNGKADIPNCPPDTPVTVRGTLEIRMHPFFRKIDWSQNIRLQPAPFVPEVKNVLDTSNFDDFDDVPSPFDNWPSDGSCEIDSATANQFYEFTFRRFFNDSFTPGCDLRPPVDFSSVTSSRSSNVTPASQGGSSAVSQTRPAQNSPQLISPPAYQIAAPPPYSAAVKSASGRPDQGQNHDHMPVYV